MKTYRRLQCFAVLGMTALMLSMCERRTAEKPSVPVHSNVVPAAVEDDTPPKAEARGEIWPLPSGVTSLGDHMWAVTLVEPKSTVHPQLHSRTMMAYQITAYDTSRKVVSGPAFRITSLDYVQPRWQRLYLQMAVGEVRRVWVVDPHEPVIIYDVEVRNVLAVK